MRFHVHRRAARAGRARCASCSPTCARPRACARRATTGRAQPRRRAGRASSSSASPGMPAPERRRPRARRLDFVLVAEEAGRAALPEPLRRARRRSPCRCSPSSPANRSRACAARARGGGRVLASRSCTREPVRRWRRRGHAAPDLRAGRDSTCWRATRCDSPRSPRSIALRRLFSVDATLDASDPARDGCRGARGVRACARPRRACRAAQLPRPRRAHARRSPSSTRSCAASSASRSAPSRRSSTTSPSAQVKLEFARPVVYAAAPTRSRSRARGRAPSTSRMPSSPPRDAAELAARTAIQVPRRDGLLVGGTICTSA